MQQESNSGLLQAGTHDAPEDSLFATLAHVEHDVDDLIAALALLGVKRCSRCRQFFRCADPGMPARIFPTTRFFIALLPYLAVSYFGPKSRATLIRPAYLTGNYLRTDCLLVTTYP